MGRSQQHAKPKKSNASVKRAVKPKQPQPQPQPSQNENVSETEPRQLSNPEQILALQRQIGNQSTQRLLTGSKMGVVQREGAMDQALEALFGDSSKQEEKQDEVHEFDRATVEETGPLAKKLAQGLAKVMDAEYEAMIQDVKGLKAIDVTAKVDRYLEAAFLYTEKGFHDYIGSENLPLVLEQINAVPGLYDKLGLLRAMEPHHGKLIGAYLGIPPLKGFDYEISTVAGGMGKDVAKGSPISVGVSDTKVDIVCKQEGEELWKQSYFLGAVGVGVALPSPVPVTITSSSGTFETLVFWSPRDFVGRVEMGAATAGANGFGYSFGVGTFQGNGSKGSLTIDMSGEVNTTGELGISVFSGYMDTVGGVSESKLPKIATGYKPKIKVTEDVDKELAITFPEESDEPGGSFKDDFLEFLAKALEAERLHATITGFRTLDKAYNVDLMQKRIKATRELINDLVEERGIDPERVMISEVESTRDEDPKQWKDPPRDRITKVHLKGTITVRSPGESSGE